MKWKLNWHSWMLVPKVIRNPNFEAAMRVVRADLAIAIVPREVATGHAQAWGLKIIPLQERWARRRFVLCHRGEDTLTPAALLLLEALTEYARKEGR